MSAEVLRKAAALMRERAEATTPDAAWTEGHYWVADYDIYGDPVQTEIGGMGGSGDAAHYSSWHPAVALAVADWLDHEADSFGEIQHAFHDVFGSEQTAVDLIAPHALAVARAYLGSES